MQFSKNKQFIYFASIVVAFVSLVLRNYPLRGDVVHLMRLDIHRNLLNCIWYKPFESLYRSLKTEQCRCQSVDLSDIQALGLVYVSLERR